MTDLELREFIARIDERLMNAARLRQEMRLAPWQLAFGGFAAGALYTAALVALIKIFSHCSGKRATNVDCAQGAGHHLDEGRQHRAESCDPVALLVR